MTRAPSVTKRPAAAISTTRRTPAGSMAASELGSRRRRMVSGRASSYSIARTGPLSCSGPARGDPAKTSILRSLEAPRGLRAMMTDNDDLQAGQPLDEGGRRVGLATFLERTWSGLTGLVKPRSAAAMFRLADQYRHRGRYEEPPHLIAEGLRVSPNIAGGHLLDAYVHVVFREMPAAKTSFRRVLSPDPYHPPAPFLLPRIPLQEGHIHGCRPLLDPAVHHLPRF